MNLHVKMVNVFRINGNVTRKMIAAMVVMKLIARKPNVRR